MTNTDPNTNPQEPTKPIAPTSDAHADVRAHLPPTPANTGRAPEPPAIAPIPAPPPSLVFPIELAESLRRGNIIAIPRRRTHGRPRTA
ncbi:MAG: hypothetical protein KF768_12990 [Phycisphaeraceae bacterium]|nr:hypothetical protein [Phycisphaeraceae bacterium]